MRCIKQNKCMQERMNAFSYITWASFTILMCLYGGIIYNFWKMHDFS